jgi:hypothetical protein
LRPLPFRVRHDGAGIAIPGEFVLVTADQDPVVEAECAEAVVYRDIGERSTMVPLVMPVIAPSFITRMSIWGGIAVTAVNSLGIRLLFSRARAQSAVLLAPSTIGTK